MLDISPDGNFVQVVGAANQFPCFVPLEKKYGETSGDCDGLPVLEPPPIPEPTEEAPDDQPVKGCTILQTDGSLICVSPCPAGVGPGDPCTIP